MQKKAEMGERPSSAYRSLWGIPCHLGANDMVSYRGSLYYKWEAQALLLHKLSPAMQGEVSWLIHHRWVRRVCRPTLDEP